MTILMMAKIVTNLSLYYAFISLFRGNGSLLPIMLSIVFCTVGIGVAGIENERVENAKGVFVRILSFLILTVPLLVLRPFSSGFTGNGIMCLLPAAYCGILILMGNLHVDNNRFETHLKYSAILYLFLFALTALWSTTWQTAAGFTVLYLYTGTWLLRQLRLGEGSDRRIRILDALISAGILLVIYLAGGLLLFALGYAKNFVNILLLPIEAILYIVAWVFWLLFSLIKWGEVEMPELFQNSDNVLGEMEQEVAESAASWDSLRMILMVAAGLIALAFVIFLIRKYKYRDKATAMEEKEIKREKLERPRHFVRNSSGDGRYSIRKLYRKYLKGLKELGMKPYPGMTSADVERDAGQILGGEENRARDAGQILGGEENRAREAANLDSLIRKLYLRARYDTSYVPVEEDFKQAKDLIKMNR